MRSRFAARGAVAALVVWAGAGIARADTLVSLVGDKDNFGYGLNPIPNLFFDNRSGPLPTGDGTVFDHVTSDSGTSAHQWTHNFVLPSGAVITSAVLGVREIFSDTFTSTITWDGVTSPFVVIGTTNGGPPKIQTFNISPLLLTDGALNIQFFLENTDEIALDYSELTINYDVAAAAVPLPAAACAGLMLCGSLGASRLRRARG